MASPPLKRRLTTADKVIGGLQERAPILKNQARASTLVREVGVPCFWRSHNSPTEGTAPPDLLANTHPYLPILTNTHTQASMPRYQPLSSAGVEGVPPNLHVEPGMAWVAPFIVLSYS